jgi:exopolysaccharide production protein ExoQ
MAGLIASIFTLLVIWQLFRLNREENVRTSKALWIPTFWLFIAVSRNVSAWLQYSGGSGGDQYIEGSPLDRAVLSVVLALGVIILIGRAQRVGIFLRSNLPILLYFFYCGISFIWSDYPDVSFKRWFRAVGDVVMVLIVLTDPDWLAAVRRLFSRVGFVAAPLSILFIRYFPQLGRSFSRGGSPTWTGVATDKNALGMLSLLIELASIFRFLQLYRNEKGTVRKGQFIALGSLIVMTLYLLWEANSATAFACFFLAGAPMVLTYLFPWARKPFFVNLMVVGALGVSASALFLNLGSGMVESLGRNSTLTGRTDIWRNVLPMVQNPLIGTGYESFWIGPRLARVEKLIDQTINQAHDGYIEVYLNLGWVGITLLAVVLIAAYRRVMSGLRLRTPLASLWLAYFIVVGAYNFTEAGFKMMHPVWITFLLVALSIPDTFRQDDSPPLTVKQANLIRPNRQVKPEKQLSHRSVFEDSQRRRELWAHCG